MYCKEFRQVRRNHETDKKIMSFAVILAMLVQCCICGEVTLKVQASETAQNEEVSEKAADNAVPEITSIRLLTAGEIYSNTELQYEVGYQDGDGDITNISMMFEDARGSYSSLTLYPDYSTKFDSLGTVILKTGNDSLPLGEYHLRYASIRDLAGNNIQYNYNEEWDTYIANDEKGAEHTLKIDDDILVIKPYPFKGLELKSLRIEDGAEKDKLTAGDTFVMTAVLKNTGETVQIIRPGECLVQWKNPVLDVYGSSSNYSLNPGEEGTATYALFAGKPVRIEPIPHNKEADYTVISSEEMDTEAPFIESVSVNTPSVRTPGEVSFDIKVSEEGFAKAVAFEVQFKDASMEYSENVISLDSDQTGILTYSKERECYVYTVDLDASVVKAVYKLTRITVRDQAGNYRGYYKNGNGELEDMLSGNSLSKICDLEVAESQSKDYDFYGAELFDCMSVNEAVTAGGEI